MRRGFLRVAFQFAQAEPCSLGDMYSLRVRRVRFAKGPRLFLLRHRHEQPPLLRLVNLPRTDELLRAVLCHLHSEELKLLVCQGLPMRGHSRFLEHKTPSSRKADTT